MLKNEEIVEKFKKSLSATVKSIGKNNNLEVNFVKENPSIEGNSINLTEPNIDNIKKNLTSLRGEADSIALEFSIEEIAELFSELIKRLFLLVLKKELSLLIKFFLEKSL